jgi:hypothetical protein
VRQLFDRILDLHFGEAAKRGEIDVLEVGRLKKAITAPLRRKLGIDAA